MFKVTIEEVTVKDEKVKEYQRIYDRSPEMDQSNFGYVEVVKPVTRSRQVLIQEIDGLDLSAVIKAINGL